jgi:glycosyltransferase involved in cell wall biosynthesis
LKIIRLTTLLDFGGQERKLISFTDHSKNLKNEYIFAAIGHGGKAEEIIKNRGFKVYCFNTNPSIYNLKNIWTLYKWFKKEEPELVHTAAAEANFHGIIAAKLAGVKYIVGEEIGIPNHSKQARFIFKQIYKRAQNVVCVSKAVKQNLIELGEINHNQGTVIYNTVSQPKKYDRIKNQNFTILTVGRLAPVKNLDILIKAISMTEDQKIRLIIVGDGPERNNLENLAKSEQIENRVNFIGFSNEPEKYLAQADLFVLPSFSEGFGIAAVESMFCEVPCLCTNVGGIPELIKENKTGWLFNPYGLDELVEKINTITKLETKDLEKVGRNGRQYAFKNFTSKKYIETLERFYTSLQQ